MELDQQQRLQRLLSRYSKLACIKHETVYVLPPDLIGRLRRGTSSYSYGRPGKQRGPLLTTREEKFERSFHSICRRMGKVGIKGGEFIKLNWCPMPYPGNPHLRTLDEMYRRLRGHAGYLVTNEDFLQEWHGIRSRFHNVIDDIGYPLGLPNPRHVVPAHTLKDKKLHPVAKFYRAYWCFCQRWCINGMLDEKFPGPTLPLKGAYGMPPTLSGMGTYILIPWWYRVGSREDLYPFCHTSVEIRKRGIERLRARLKRPKRLNVETPYDTGWVNHLALREASGVNISKKGFSCSSYKLISQWISINRNTSLEDFIAASPALWRAPTFDYKWRSKESAFLLAFYVSELNKRYPRCFERGNRQQTTIALQVVLGISERQFKKYRATLRKSGYWPSL